MAGFRRNVRRDDSHQRIARNIVFPDVPGWLLVISQIRIEWAAHREQDSATVHRDLGAHNITQTLGLTYRDIALDGRGRSAFPHIQIGADVESQYVANIRARE